MPVSPDTQDSRAARFERCVRPHVSHLYALAYRLCGSVPDAEDLVQDVLLKVFARTDEMAAMAQLRPWLARVLYHEFISGLRREARRPEQRQRRAPWDEAQAALEQVASPAETPEAASERGAVSAQVHQALSRLDSDERALVTFHLMEERGLNELSGIFNAPVGTLKSRLHRSKAKLKKLLKLGTFRSL